MQRLSIDQWLRRARQFAIGAGVVLATTVLTVGCGGGGGGGTAPPPFTEIAARDIAVEVAVLAFDFEDYLNLLLDAQFGAEDPSAIIPLSADVEPSSNPLVNVTRSILNLTKGAGEINIQSTAAEFCDSGNVAITETAVGYEMVFDACRYDVFGTTYQSDGKVTYLGTEADGTLSYDEFQVSLSKAGDILILQTNGTIDLVLTNALVGAGEVKLDLSYNLTVTCGGSEESLSLSYDNLVIEVANDGGITIAGGLSFMDGTTSFTASIATVEPIRVENELSEYPSSGKVNGSLGRETTTFEYVESGVLINGQFVSWAEIEADHEDDFDIEFDQCRFLDFDSEV
jgi:hypothetical protein